MEAENFTPSDSIKIIEKALSQAKSEKTGAYYYYTLWGALLFIHYLLLFLISRFPDFKGGLLTTIIWSVFPFGGLLSYLRSKKDEKTEKVLSHYEKVYLYAFGGFALAYGIIFISSIIQQSSLFVSLFPLLLGLAVFVVGGITKNKISLISGVLAIIMTAISLNTSIEFQYLVASLASLITCLLPGLLMKKRNV